MTLEARNLNTLPVLRALLEEVSVVGAARRVGLSQPTVSGILARLRTDFGDPLLVRAGRGMKLTPRGRELQPAVAALCIELEDLYAPEEFRPGELERSFVIAAPDHLAFLLAPVLLRHIAPEAPGVRLRFVDVPIDLDRVLGDEIDVAICANFGLWTSPRYEYLFPERIVAAVAEDHPLAGQDTVTVEQLRQFPHSRMRSDSGRTDAPSTGNPILDIDATITFSQFTDAVLMTIGSDLVAPAPEALVDHLAQILPLAKARMADSDSHDAGMFWAATFDNDPAHAWLRGIVRAAAASLNEPPASR